MKLEQDSKTPTICVVLVNYNGGDFLRQCLESLRAQSFTDFEIVIVDNCSEDGSLKAAADLCADCKILELGENTGFARGNNIGVGATEATWIATLNVDARADPNWLAVLVDATERFPDAVMFGSTQVKAEDPDILDGAGDVYHVSGMLWRGGFGHALETLPPEGECFGPCAAAALYRRDVFLAVGGFDEKYFCYCEDIDLAFRLRLRGYRNIQVAAAVVHHHGSAISGLRSDFSVYHGMRNRFWTFVKNMPGPLLVLFMPAHILATLLNLAIILPRGTFLSGVKGLIAGLSGLPDILGARRKIQADRIISASQIIRAMTWSPLAAWRRKPDIRPSAIGDGA